MKKIVISLALVMAFISGCTNTDTSTNPSVDPTLEGKSNLKVYLVDSPAALDSVIIFVKRVEVHKADSDSTASWYVINDSLRSFDLLELRNGTSAVLGDSILEPGHYTQIRLILDDGCYVVDNGVRYNLTVPSGLQTGIKLNHEFTLEANNLYELVLDFNLEKSIHVTGNGKYMMKPVIRVMPIITSGSISGQVLPLDAQATVFTTIGDDTVSTYPNTDGFFKLMVLPQGLYNVEIASGNEAYKDTVLTGVSVSANQNNDLGTIELENK